MGNSTSSGRGHQDDTVDFGYLTPQGIYSGSRDWNQTIVAQLICERKLAPFYRPLEDYDESWDEEQILAARKEPVEAEGTATTESSSIRAESINSAAARSIHHKRTANQKEPSRSPEAAIYRDAVDCPICFLYYPPNINRSRCCDQAICTECFVQIKRADPTTTHCVSEPASCPYCVQDNFGVIYTPPPWRTGIGSEGAPSPVWPESPKGSQPNTPVPKQRRRKSFGADNPDVVTIDQIRPDWEAKLAAVRAAVARRANRRIIMRQVGDRLIPVGVTSGRVHPLSPEDLQAEVAEGGVERGSRRSRRRQQNPEVNQLLGQMGFGGQDLEELMIMEAMRLSLIEHEEQQKRQKEEEAKKQEGTSAEANTSGVQGDAPSSSLLALTRSSSSNAAILPKRSESPLPPIPQESSTSLPPLPPSASDMPLPATPTTVSETDTVNSRSSLTGRDRLPPVPVEDELRSNSRWKRRSHSHSPSITAAVRSATSTASAAISPSGTTPVEGSEPLALSTALRRVTSTATAVTSPDVEEERTEWIAGGSTPVSENDVLATPLPKTPIQVDNTILSTATTVESASSDEQGDEEATPSLRTTFPRHPTSFTSSIVSMGDGDAASSSYDVLPSSPDSTISHKPLLDVSDADVPSITVNGEARPHAVSADN